MLYKSKTFELLELLDIVGFKVGMYDEYCLWAQVVVLLMLGLYCPVWDRYVQVWYLGRALCTKETLSDFLKWRRVTRHPLVFRGLTGSQRPPEFGVSQTGLHSSHHFLANKQLLAFAFGEGRQRFHVQKDHLYSKNRCHSYCNYFVLVVSPQIVNLEELVFDKIFLIFYAKFLTCLFGLLLVQN